jgi:hypothetical protein
VKNFIRLRSVSIIAMLSRSGQQPVGEQRQIDHADQATQQMPSGVISKMPKGASPCSRRHTVDQRLVEVPISVIVPPRIDRYDSGIISLDGETCIAGPAA